MAIIRFLGKNDTCFQVHTPETPILIFLTNEEKKKMLETPDGQCLMLLDGRLSEKETKTKTKLLNTKEDPQMMV